MVFNFKIHLLLKNELKTLFLRRNKKDGMTESDDNQLFNSSQPTREASFQPSIEPQGNFSPFIVLAMCLGMFVVGNLIASSLMMWLSLQVEGKDLETLLKTIGENSPIKTRNFMRVIMLLNHLFSFIIPSILTVFIVYKSNISKYFRFNSLVSGRQVFWGFVWLLVSVPLVQFAFQLNKSLPLPEWMITMEDSTNKILETIISKESPYEILVNIFIIAILPGIGEELMFRGLIQQQMGRILKNEHLTVWISAAFFSAIHMQFQGFLARMILGALLGYLLVWTRTLWVPIIVHFLNNGLQIVALYAMNIKPDEMNKIEQGDKIHWSVAMISLMFVLMIGKYIRENIGGLTPIFKDEPKSDIT